jgi:hypothetical protein
MTPQAPQPAGSPQFYTVSPQPTPPSSPKIKPRVILMVLGGVMVLGLIGVAVFNVWQSRPAAIMARQAAAELAARTASCPEGDASCVATAQTVVAQGMGRASYCDGLEPSAYTTCVTRIAKDQHKPATCDVLTGSDLDVCRDLAVYALADFERSLKVCDQAATEAGRQACQNNIKSLAIATLECEAYGVEQVLCETQGALEAVVAAGQPEGCATLGDEAARVDCLDIFTSTDADGDGLSLMQEYEIGTQEMYV